MQRSKRRRSWGVATLGTGSTATVLPFMVFCSNPNTLAAADRRSVPPCTACIGPKVVKQFQDRTSIHTLQYRESGVHNRTSHSIDLLQSPANVRISQLEMLLHHDHHLRASHCLPKETHKLSFNKGGLSLITDLCQMMIVRLDCSQHWAPVQLQVRRIWSSKVRLEYAPLCLYNLTSANFQRHLSNFSGRERRSSGCRKEADVRQARVKISPRTYSCPC